MTAITVIIVQVNEAAYGEGKVFDLGHAFVYCKLLVTCGQIVSAPDVSVHPSLSVSCTRVKHTIWLFSLRVP